MDDGRFVSESDVCVIICALNAENTIIRAVESSLDQPEVREVVVVDDGSSDATAERARGCDDGSGRLRVERLESNVGPSEARNHAISISTAPLICILDADDYLRSGRINQMLSRGFDDWDFLADDLFMLKQGQTEESATRLLDGTTHPDFIDFNTFIRENVGAGAKRNQLGYLKPIIRRSFLDEIGLRYDSRLRLGEDYVLYATAIARGARFRLIEACGYVAVQSDSSLSHVHSVADLEALQQADQELMALDGLSRTETKSLKYHARFLSWKISQRHCIQAKKEARYFTALTHVLDNPRALPYIAREYWNKPR